MAKFVDILAIKPFLEEILELIEACASVIFNSLHKNK
jgi:hypothetical protein